MKFNEFISINLYDFILRVKKNAINFDKLRYDILTVDWEL